ncbi:nucleosome assembly 1-like 1 isoform X2, partial [Brachionus plicatilis]
MEKSQNGGEEPAPISLPKEVVKRVNALKNIQLKMVDIETKFYDELHRLECRYAAMFDPLYAQRELIVNGAYEPNEQEGRWALEEELASDLESKAVISEVPSAPECT